MNKKTPKQIAALLCVILLVAMYLATFIIAFLDTAKFGQLFGACLVATIGLPILLWLFVWFYGIMKERQTEVNLPQNTEKHDKTMSSGNPSDNSLSAPDL